MLLPLSTRPNYIVEEGVNATLRGPPVVILRTTPSTRDRFRQICGNSIVEYCQIFIDIDLKLKMPAWFWLCNGYT